MGSHAMVPTSGRLVLKAPFGKMILSQSWKADCMLFNCGARELKIKQ